jgi:hypothetical protein
MSATSTTSLNESGNDNACSFHRERHTELPPVGQNEDWVRLPKPGCLLLGLGRTYLFQLSKCGKIKTVSLREPGKQRGVRLIFLPSVRSFIEAKAALQNGGAQ